MFYLQRLFEFGLGLRLEAFFQSLAFSAFRPEVVFSEAREVGGRHRRARQIQERECIRWHVLPNCGVFAQGKSQ
jgi:hypothetical protein